MKAIIPGSRELHKYAQITLLSLALCEALTGCPGSGSSSDQGNNIKDSVSNPTANVCESGKIQIGTASYTTIQSAIDAAKDSDVISVGVGLYNEALVIKAKTNLTLKTVCGAQANSIQIIGSKSITVSGFYINTGKAKSHGILIGSNEWRWSPRGDGNDDVCGSDDDQEDSDSYANENILITNNIVSGIKDIPAVMVKGHAKNIQVINNAIYNNYAGVVFFPSGKFSDNTHTISQNKIYMNDYDGLMIWGEHTRYSKNKYVITSNSINQNGQKKQSRDGYGLKIIGTREEDFDKRDPSDDKNSFLLQNNVIAFNNGQVEKNRSTVDVYRYDGVFDSQDTNNQTSTGSEAPGIVAAFTYTQLPVIEMVSANNFLTRFPSYLLLGSITTPVPVTVTVTQNGKIVSTSNNYQIYVPLTLTEGQNTIVVSVKDYFGNTASSTISGVLDTIPPKLTSCTPADGSTLYTNHFPFNVPLTCTTNEAIQSASVNSAAAVLSDSTTFATSAIFNQAGDNVVAIQATDLAGNVGTYSIHENIIFDNVPPQITLGLADGLTVGTNSVDLPVSVVETSPLSCVLNVNNEDIFTTIAQNFTAPVSLTNEGANAIKVTCTDAAGNVGTASLNLIRDTAPPTIASVYPGQGQLVSGMMFTISGTASEPLSSAKVNGVALTVSGSSFSGPYVSSISGDQTVTYQLTDLVGNTASYDVNFSTLAKLLQANLISIVPDQDKVHFWLMGGDSAARPGVQVSAYESLFSLNRGTVTASSTGAFAIKLYGFDQVTVSAYDSNRNETATATISFNLSTTLSGVVKDVFGSPLANATVSITGMTISVKTDGNGVFSISNPTTGDEAVIIDGSTILQPTSSATRSYSKTRMAVNIGRGQSNNIPTPIYLTPLMLDGSQTTITSGGGATVTNPATASGVQINIPAGTVVFPDGTNSGAINIMTVPANRATTPVPQNFVPTNVVSLEPSGTQFNQPVDLALPNDNNLPAGTPMAFLSMNSAKGHYEVNGTGKVSNDGQSVVTDPGKGITHFSTVYAVPLAPLIAFMQNPNVTGIDLTQSNVTSSVKIPSFKIFGQSVAPAIIYKSGWANPTVLVSANLQIPNPQNITQSGIVNGTSNYDSGSHLQTNCWYVIQNWEQCSSEWVQILQQTSYVNNWQSTNMWIPQSVSSQFFVGTMTSDQVSQTLSQDNTSQIQQIQGTPISNAAATQILTQTGIPTAAVMSYAVQLIDPATGQYMSSGIHPALARFQIKLQNLTITTTTLSTATTTSVNVQSGSSNDTTTFGPQNNTVTQTQIDSTLVSLMPQDLKTDILLQNKVNSPAGRGWQVNGAEKIYNPTNTKVMLEEADGSVATYAVNNTINTLYNGNGTSVDLAHGVDISTWPNAYMMNFDTSVNSYLTQVDLSSQSPSLLNVGLLSTISGQIANQGYANCGTTPGCDAFGCRNFYTGTFNPTLYNYKTKFVAGGLVHAGNGQFFLANNEEHALYSFNGASSKIAGAVQDVDSYIYSKSGNTSYFNHATSDVDQACINLFGSPCSNPQQQAALDCDLANSHYDGYWGQNCQYECNSWVWTTCVGWKLWCNPVWVTTVGPITGQTLFANSNGQIGIPGSDANSFNAPTFSIGSPSGQVIIADTGNNRVQSYDPASGSITTIAGNTQNIDSGDGGPAVNAGIYHPQGLAFDNNGNLYISSANGYIRKVDSSGNISTFAGLPLSSGGQYGDQAAANVIYLNNPQGMVFDSSNQLLYVADSANNRVLQINMSTGIANKIAGSGSCSQGTTGATMGDGGPALYSSLCNPTTLGFDDQNNLIVVDAGHSAIRRVIFNSVSAGSLAYAPSNRDMSRLFKNSDGTWTRQYRNGSYSYFDQNGYQTRATDLLGRQTNFTYDANYNLNQVQFPNGQSISYDFSSGQLKSITDTAGRMTSFNYAGNLLSQAVFPDGTSKSFTYDSNGQMLSETDQRGNTAQYVYNAWNRLNKVINPDGTTQVLSDFASQSMAPSTSMQTVPSTQVTNANNNTTVMTPDYMGFISTIQDAMGNITKIARDLQGRPLTVTKPDGTMVTMTYDPVTGDTLSTTDNALNITESKTYDIYGHVLTQTDGNGLITTNSYDQSTGLLMEVTYPPVNGVSPIVDYSYYTQDPMKGLIYQKIVQNGGTSILTTYTYNNLGQVATVTDNGGKSTNFTYDLAGNQLKSISTTTGTDQLITSYVFDLFNRLTKVTSPKGEITQYSYYKTGELYQITDPKGNITSFNYDSSGRLTSKTDTLGLVYQFSYDGNGNRTSEVDPNGNTKTYQYDALNRMTQANFPDDVVVYGYDLRGNMISTANSVSQVQTTVDTKKRVTFAQTTGLGIMASYPTVGMTYSYDSADNRLSLQTAFGSLGYSYDSDNRLTQISNNWGDAFNYNFDIAGRLTQISRPGSATNYYYTDSGTLSLIQHVASGNTIDSAQYTYDQRNFPTQKRTPAGDFNYSYDTDGQLVGATSPTQSAESYTYDSLGNRLTDADAHLYGYDNKGQRLLDDGLYIYQYDNNGNITVKAPKDTTKEAFKFYYSSKNQLIKTQVLDGTLGPVKREVNYVYDVLGRRMQKSVVDNTNPSDTSKTYTRQFIYDGQNILFEFDGSGNLLTRYTNNPFTLDDVLAVNVTSAGVTQQIAQTSGNYYYLKDHLGSITDIADSGGNILQKYDYKSSFGLRTSVTDGSGTDISASPVLRTTFTYTGREWEEDVGLFYYRARWYDPSVGRFLQEDPEPGKIGEPSSFNSKYIYVKNSPIRFTDPRGLYSIGEFFRDLVTIIAVVIFTPIITVALLGTGASALATFAMGTVIGSAVGAVAGGLANTAFGVGTFEDGFKRGAGIGALLGGASAYYLQGFGDSAISVINSYLPSRLPSIPHGVGAASATSFGVGAFTFVAAPLQSCPEGMEYSFESSQCKPKESHIPIYSSYN